MRPSLRRSSQHRLDRFDFRTNPFSVFQQRRFDKALAIRRTRRRTDLLLTNDHRAYAACDSVVIVVEVRTHRSSIARNTAE